MKKLIFSIALLCFGVAVLAQSPNLMSYQAIIRNASNQLIVNAPIGVRVSVLQGSATGTVVFRETYNPNPTTNSNGLLGLNIGSGLSIIGSFAQVNWSQGPYFVQVEADPNGGTNYTISSVSQLLSVPYALHAKTAEVPGLPGPQGPIGLTGPQGPQGPAGSNGAVGPQGPIGLTGPAGPQGPAGSNGAVGPQGPIGLTGPTGPQGVPGNDGAVGPQGPIGLTGPAGPQGPIGLTGPAGPQGAPGNDGAVGPQGPIGLTGPTGPQGVPGNDGAVGPQGPIGLTGPAGPQGVPGNDGAVGPQGPIGLTGPTGPQGAPGNDGAVGPQGPIGLTGPTGPQGVPGNDGAVGPQGPIGLTGPAGPQGSFPPGTQPGEMNYWNGTAWVSVPPGINGQVLTFCNGVPSWNGCFPSVTTTPISNITLNSAITGGNVVSPGISSVTARGVAYNTVTNPTTSNNTTSNGAGVGVFTTNLIGLTHSTTYYVRAYATNSVGTAYGNEVNFMTTEIPSFTCGASSVTDIDGNTYNTVQIGTQCWTQSNLKVTKYRNGDSIPTGLSNNQWDSTTSGAYAIYNSDPVYDALYGKLYNWYAVADSRGLCPTGWHVPSDGEWTTLTTFLGGEYVAGGAMKSTVTQPTPGGWYAPNSATNSSGFTGLPGGTWGPGGWHGNSPRNFGGWWSSSDAGSGYAWIRGLSYASSDILRLYFSRSDGFSVRCCRD